MIVYGLLALYSAIFTSFILFFAEHFLFPKKLWRLASCCDHCQQKLKWYYLIPIFSFIFLKRKTACCQKRISWHYIIFETVCPLFTCLLFAKHNSFSVSFLYEVMLFNFLIIFATTDYLYMHVSFKLLLLELAVIAMINMTNAHFYSIIFCYSLFYGLLFVLFRKGIGSGDLLLFTIYGAALGFPKGYFLFLDSLILSLIVLTCLLYFNKLSRKTKIPFVPFIFASFIWVMLVN